MFESNGDGLWQCTGMLEASRLQRKNAEITIAAKVSHLAKSSFHAEKSFHP
jgi:hypothetical protein